ncbi:DUF6783 domain-containing protein [Blautia faecis]|uniref:DUF6783 domain-containing protein n=1 Tax=Blautia faecis TaxID=871665 RepID=UPI003A7F2596
MAFKERHIQTNFPKNCDTHLAENLFQTRSRACRLQEYFFKYALKRGVPRQ